MRTGLLTNAPADAEGGVAFFVVGYLAAEPDGHLPTTEVYTTYRDVVDAHEFPAVSNEGRNAKFTPALKKLVAAHHGVSVERKRVRLDGERTQCYTNITWASQS